MFCKPDPIVWLQERFAFDPYLFMIYNFWKPIDQTNNKCGLDESSPYKKYKVPFYREGGLDKSSPYNKKYKIPKKI